MNALHIIRPCLLRLWFNFPWRKPLRQVFSRLWPVWLIAALLVSGQPASAGQKALNGQVWYARPGQQGDCRSWSTACDLPAALAQAAAGDEIRLAAGVYTPGPSGDRTATFSVPGGVRLLGGYSGSGLERDWLAYPSVLSGDLNGDDGPDFANYEDNSYHVVTALDLSADTLLEGLVIRAGSAIGSDPEALNERGGGLLVNAGALNSHTMTLQDVKIEASRALRGGGIYSRNSRITAQRLTLANNHAVGTGAADGGGGWFADNSRLQVNGSVILTNTGNRGGGLLLTNNAELLLEDSTFAGNAALNDLGPHFSGKSMGGGLFANFPSRVVLREAVFANNRASDGGGVGTMGISPVISQSVFLNNHAFKPPVPVEIYGSGGGMFAQGGSPVLVNVVFYHNLADDYGGAIDAYLVSRWRMANVLFDGNRALYGGAVSNAASNMELHNITAANNQASKAGGGLYNMTSGNLTVYNSLVWGNSAPLGPGVYNQPGPSRAGKLLLSDYSTLQDCDQEGWVATCGDGGPENNFSDPLFENINGHDFQLRGGSPALNSASNALILPDLADLDQNGNISEPTPFDLAGNPRIFRYNTEPPGSGVVDRGAFERFGPFLTALDLALNADEDTPISGQVSALHVTEPAVYEAAGAPSVAGQHFDFRADGSFDYHPPLDYHGPVSFPFRVRDGTGQSSQGIVTLTFRPVNDPPENTALPQIEGVSHAGRVLRVTSPGEWNDNRDGGSDIHFEYQWQRADDTQGHNLVDIPLAHAAEFTPGLEENGRYVRVRVTAIDSGVGQPASQSAVAYSTYVRIENQAPQAEDGWFEAFANQVVSGQLLASDPDGDPLTFTLAEEPQAGQVQIEPDGTFLYSPPSGWLGVVRFTFHVSDGLGGEHSGLVEIHYHPLRTFLPLIQTPGQ